MALFLNSLKYDGLDAISNKSFNYHIASSSEIRTLKKPY